MKKILLIIISFLFFSLLSAYSEQSNNSGKPIVLRYADSLVKLEINNMNIRQFFGNVRLEQGIVHVTCDKAVQFLDENRVELTGNVVITQEDLIMRSPRVNYNGNTGLAEAWIEVHITDNNARLRADRGTYSTQTRIADFHDNVKVEDDTVTITANRVQYERTTRISHAWGNVKVEDDSTIIYSDLLDHFRFEKDSYAYQNVIVKGKYTNSYLTGDTIINLTSKSYSRATGNPVLYQIDTVKGKNFNEEFPEFDTLTVASDSMETVKQDSVEKYIFKGNVQIHRSNVDARSRLGKYMKKDEIIELTGDPVLWYDSTQLHSDTIMIYIPQKHLKLIDAHGNALAAARNDTVFIERISQLAGDDVKLNFNHDTITSICGYGNTKSLYFAFDDRTPKGFDRSGQDTIILNFVDRKIDNTIKLGAVQGGYYPENLVGKNTKEFFLPNFRWSDIRPKKQTLIYTKKDIINVKTKS